VTSQLSKVEFAEGRTRALLWATGFRRSGRIAASIIARCGCVLRLRKTRKTQAIEIIDYESFG